MAIQNLDKTHAIGQADDAGKQKRIMRFTTDSVKETVFKKAERKTELINCGAKRKNQQICVGIKFQPSLKRQHIKCL